MSVLYITEQGAKIYRSEGRLVVEKDDIVIINIPVNHVERIYLIGQIQLTTQAICLLLAHGIPVAFISQEGKLKGFLEPVRSKNVPVRVEQLRKAIDYQFALEFSKRIVYAKIRNQRRMLQKWAYNRGEDISFELDRLDYLLAKVPRKNAQNALRGVEGMASAIYFETFGKFIGKEKFIRTRRPPRDPINALLSYGYSIMLSDCINSLGIAGLNPYIGYYHGIRYGRPALALDIIEEFRSPVVDSFVMDMVLHRKILPSDDFEETYDGGYRIKKEPRRKFLMEFEKRMKRVRRQMLTQAENVIDCVLKNKPYEGFYPG